MNLRLVFPLILLVVCPQILYSAILKGRITDSSTGEVLVGATVFVKEFHKGTLSGLDGSYYIKGIPRGDYSVICSFIGYQTVEKIISVQDDNLSSNDFSLNVLTNQLNQVVITSHTEKGSDISARISEKLSGQILNIVSAKTIELSPDLTVGNVIQRVSGVTVERSATGEGQYALLRGMDKRFNYTLINGIKIPSPDNKNRFVPLDIFPS